MHTLLCTTLEDCFKLFELSETVHQKDDAWFGELLGRLRTASCTTDDYTLLQSCKISLHNATYPRAALHVFRTNALVDEHNNDMLQTACGDNTLHAIPVEDSLHGQPFTTHECQCWCNDTGDLLHILHVKIGAIVMLTINLDVSSGLVNGAIGVIKFIINKNGRVKLIYVEFNNVVSTESMCSHSGNEELHGTVGIRQHQSKFLPKFKKQVGLNFL